MRRVLIVAYYFPPIGGIGSIRLARFAACLPDFGWEPTVLAPLGTPHALDPHLDFPEEKVVRSRSIELSRLGRSALGARENNQSSSQPTRRALRDRLRTGAHRFLFYPDAQIGWYPGAVISGLRTLRSEPFDAIYSSSNPLTAHLIARTLSRTSRLPWVAEFRDPWRDRLPRDHPYRRHATALEASVAASASRVAMPTPTWAAHYGRQWGTEVALLPNGHDAESQAPRPPDQPTITYMGSYYPGVHSLTAVWDALNRLRHSRPSEVPRIRFVGEFPAELREEIAGFGLGDLVEATGFLPHDEAMQNMSASSMLIASGIAGDQPATRGWVPAKLFEYLASGLSILYLADPASDAAQLLAGQPGCYVVEPDDVAGAGEALRSGLATTTHQRDLRRFTRRHGARVLADILDQVTDERRRPPGPGVT